MDIDTLVKQMKEQSFMVNGLVMSESKKALVPEVLVANINEGEETERTISEKSMSLEEEEPEISHYLE